MGYISESCILARSYLSTIKLNEITKNVFMNDFSHDDLHLRRRQFNFNEKEIFIFDFTCKIQYDLTCVNHRMNVFDTDMTDLIETIDIILVSFNKTSYDYGEIMRRNRSHVSSQISIIFILKIVLADWDILSAASLNILWIGIFFDRLFL
jgi:hypothetical protein